MNPARIVLVEDNPADILLVKLALKENGIEHTLYHYATGEKAVQALCAENGSGKFSPDAVLLDLNTPASDGFNVVVKLRACFPGVPVTILTSSRARSDKNRAAEMRVPYVEKPSELNRFVVTVGEAVKSMLEVRLKQLAAYGEASN